MIEYLFSDKPGGELMREIIVESIIWISVLGMVLAIIVGALLILKPQKLEQINKYLNRWYSTRRTLKPLEVMRETDTFVYQHNKVIGWLFLIASVFCLFVYLSLSPSRPIWEASLTGGYTENLIDILQWTVKLFFILFVGAGIPVWILLIVNPEKLKKISASMNRWISTRLMLLPLENMHYDIDTYVIKHNKLFGLVFIVSSFLLLMAVVVLIRY